VSGLEVVRILRASPEHRQIAVIMLTAKGSEMDRIQGFELGADDYVVKPFSVKEVLLRVQAILRRKDAGADSGEVLKAGPVELDTGRHRVEVRAGVVFVDGWRVHPSDGAVYVTSPPTFRRDGGAVAWIDRAGAERRLLVLPALGPEHREVLPWQLPAADRGDQIFWAGPNRVVIGPGLFAPRAVASWTE
jgi:hypothetical protein